MFKKDIVIEDIDKLVILCKNKCYDEWFTEWSNEELEDIISKLHKLRQDVINTVADTISAETIEDLCEEREIENLNELLFYVDNEATIQSFSL